MTPEQKAERRLKRRTSHLKKAVAIQAQEMEPTGNARNAGREMVPYWAYKRRLCKEPTVASLAQAIGEDRSSLTNLLAIARGGVKTRMRRKLEDHLELTPGGMTDVLAVLEEL
ncbi:MAG: hypothetical protein KAJ55_00070 [Anaerolineales bacterium]|nr:hypothetical protein [Anaerolineales bacterium]